MPQATDELRQRMLELFGDPSSDEGPMNFLLEHGFILSPSFGWMSPAYYYSWNDLSPDQQDCIDFLFQEWDHGGVTFDALPSNRD